MPRWLASCQMSKANFSVRQCVTESKSKFLIMIFGTRESRMPLLKNERMFASRIQPLCPDSLPVSLHWPVVSISLFFAQANLLSRTFFNSKHFQEQVLPMRTNKNVVSDWNYRTGQTSPTYRPIGLVMASHWQVMTRVSQLYNSTVCRMISANSHLYEQCFLKWYIGIVSRSVDRQKTESSQCRISLNSVVEEDR